MNHYEDSTKQYALHDAESFSRFGQALRDAIIRQLKFVFVKLITSEKMAAKEKYKSSLNYIMQGHLSYLSVKNEMNLVEYESFVDKIKQSLQTFLAEELKRF